MIIRIFINLKNISEHDEMGLFIVTTLLVIAYSHMIYGIINELCDHLNIYCFKIKAPAKQ